MPSPRRRSKARSDELPTITKMRLIVGDIDPAQAAELWRLHGSRLLRDDPEARPYAEMIEAYGVPPGWTAQDERERRARRAEIEAGWDRRRRQFREQNPGGTE